MIIIFAGSIGRFPIGGQAWCEMQYLLSLRKLGHNIYFLEECGEGSWVYNWETEQITTDLDYPTTYIRKCLNPIGYDDRWIYRAGNDSVGMRLNDFLEVCSQADLLLIRGSPIPLWRPEYNWPKRRIFIDSDPGFTQLSLINGNLDFIRTVNHCDQLFTTGQRIGKEDCLIPVMGKRWIKTVLPVSLEHWPISGQNCATYFTSIMQWRSYKDIIYKGITWGNKDKEFPKFLQIPLATDQKFRIALTGGVPEDLKKYGWEVSSGWIESFNPESYQNFIQRSRAEFGVAKHGYVLSNSGWFSDRSACYLASGRPVLVQDTGQSDWLPIGEGIFTFRNLSEALQGIESINADYAKHSRAARLLAEQYFDAEKVISSLLEDAMT